MPGNAWASDVVATSSAHKDGAPILTNLCQGAGVWPRIGAHVIASDCQPRSPAIRTPRHRILILAALAGVALPLLTPTAANAAYYGSETNYVAISSGPTGDYECAGWVGVTACWKPDGDEFYVRDIQADGHSAVAEWFFDSKYGTDRTGACVNNLGEGNWGLCNKDFAEGEIMNWRGARYEGGGLLDRENTWTWWVT